MIKQFLFSLFILLIPYVGVEAQSQLEVQSGQFL